MRPTITMTEWDVSDPQRSLARLGLHTGDVWLKAAEGLFGGRARYQTDSGKGRLFLTVRNYWSTKDYQIAVLNGVDLADKNESGMPWFNVRITGPAPVGLIFDGYIGVNGDGGEVEASYRGDRNAPDRKQWQAFVKPLEGWPVDTAADFIAALAGLRRLTAEYRPAQPAEADDDTPLERQQHTGTLTE